MDRQDFWMAKSLEFRVIICKKSDKMEKVKKSYNLLIGIAALLLIVVVVALTGYLVSRPEPAVIQGQAEATALAVKSAAEAQKDKALSGARQEQIAAAYELWQQALAGEEVMKKSFDRTQRLYDQKVVSAQKYDEVQAQYRAAKATCAAAKSQYDMAVKGARKEDKETAVALVNQASAALMEVESYLGELYLTAPADGVISARFPKAGELVGQGSPIMAVTDLDDVWFTFNIREDMLKGMQVGDMLEVTVPALGDAVYRTRISYMSVLESYATWRATRDTGSYDAKTFEVRARPVQPVEGLRPGMSVILKEHKK